LRALGGGGRFSLSLFLEVLVSIAYAPILMVQQTKAVVAAFTGAKIDWTPQSRSGGRYPLRVLLRFHALETGVGLVLLAGMASGYVSPWLVPIMASLVASAPLSALSSVRLDLLQTPQEVRAPMVARLARVWRADLQKQLAPVPAE
jgi:membrane glycosyltransferase